MTVTQINFSTPLADASHYPPAQLHVHPRFSWQFWCWGSVAKQLATQHYQFYRSGRSALFHAANLLKHPEQQNKVLLPAYHCPALVEPFMAAGYQLEFYPLEADLSVVQSAFEQRLAQGCSHVLLVRFFGHSGQTEALLAQLQQAGIRTFDDCAHDLQAFLQPNQHADARICSLKKFIPSVDGGLLALKPAFAATYPKQLPPPAWSTELKTLAARFKVSLSSIVQSALTRSSKMPPLTINKPTTAVAVEKSPSVAVATGFRYLQQIDRDRNCFRLTRWLLNHSNLSAIFASRQRHASQLLQALQHSSLGRPLWTAVQVEQEALAPYVVPFLLHDAASFDWLRQQGLQIYRWEELAPTTCGVAAQYRSRLVQIPCQQNLTAAELAWICQLFR